MFVVFQTCGDTRALKDIFNHGKEQQDRVANVVASLITLLPKRFVVHIIFSLSFLLSSLSSFASLYSDLIGLTTKTKESSLDFLLQSESITFTVKLLPVTFVQKVPRIHIPCLSQLWSFLRLPVSFESGESMGVPMSDRCGGGIRCWQYITNRESCTRFAAWMALVI